MASTRRRSWTDTQFNVASLTDGVAQEFNLLLNAPAADTRTVIRLIGDIYVFYSPNSTIADTLSTVACGIGVVAQEAFAIKGTSMPNPSIVAGQDPARGWLYAATQPVFQSVQTEGVFVHVAEFKFDLRAMRKIDKGILFLTLEQNDVLTGGSMRVIGRVRVLCLA